MEDLFKLFRMPPPDVALPSAAPGAGPAQARSNRLPWRSPIGGTPGSGKPGTPIEAETEQPSDTGYGGGGDVARTTPQAEGLTPTAQRARSLRELIRMAPPGPAVPRYNVLYDTLRTRDAWRYVSDAVDDGNFVAAASVSVPLTIKQSIVGGILGRQSQYPGGIQLHVVVNAFSSVPRATTQTGTITFYFQDMSGSQLIPLGVGDATFPFTGVDLPKLCTNPLTDAGINGGQIGTLIISTGGGGTFATWDFQIGFAFAYLLPDPAFSGYKALLPQAEEQVSGVYDVQRRM